MSHTKTQANLTAPRPPLSAPLSPHWAFVVQLREGTVLTPEGMWGRVEHIVSGQATLFTSLEEMRAFMERVLATQRREADQAEKCNAKSGASV